MSILFACRRISQNRAEFVSRIALAPIFASSSPNKMSKCICGPRPSSEPDRFPSYTRLVPCKHLSWLLYLLLYLYARPLANVPGASANIQAYLAAPFSHAWATAPRHLSTLYLFSCLMRNFFYGALLLLSNSLSLILKYPSPFAIRETRAWWVAILVHNAPDILIRHWAHNMYKRAPGTVGTRHTTQEDDFVGSMQKRESHI